MLLFFDCLLIIITYFTYYYLLSSSENIMPPSRFHLFFYFLGAELDKVQFPSCKEFQETETKIHGSNKRGFFSRKKGCVRKKEKSFEYLVRE